VTLRPRRLARAHVRQDVEAGQVRHHHVEEHQGDVVLAIEHVDRLTAVEGQRDAKRPLLELHLDDAADVGLVIGHQHMPRDAHG
jgi:hypothetical protein